MLDVRKSRDLQAAILAMRSARREVRTNINREARREMKPILVAALTKRADHPMDRPVLLKGAGVTVGADRVAVRAATSNRLLSGGFWPAGDWHAVEFGARNRRAEITRRDGTTYTAVLNRGLPGRNPHQQGRVVFPAASELGTKLVAIWVRTIVAGFTSVADIEDR